MMMKRLLPAALALSVLGISSTACATGYAYGRDRGRYDGAYYRDMERRAYDNGFRDGVRAGEHDGRDRRRFEPTRHGDWRDGDDGFRREYGDRGVYRRNFRAGFEAGYAQGYRQYDRGYRRY
jgi:hypothetical protein